MLTTTVIPATRALCVFCSSALPGSVVFVQLRVFPMFNPENPCCNSYIETTNPEKTMTRYEYREARRLIRDNGFQAMKWLAPHVADAMDSLYFQMKDRLAERENIVQYCRREGISCNPRQTA